ncbi:fumarylacetoacetate hydrolase family protein [Variovorax sp. J22G21]|uniref:fumarylacetoacetate hydrolase family protein n=1 Tax=Variovorax fucosicus TaxID=3053517 RepID=UPI00257671C3|nr:MULTISPECIES: fumarylacetoacetate hydrolase family protein [unclassified Variovorax]MDM0041222.1 fumarylacetoacetate hydrolase family protein [Variovorax sp. J22R193]MDM0060279.1 fumarylacetoacetate hydrolase family protein [Variovorax sp. J22G21]
MTEFVFPALAPTTLPVAGSTAVFPVGRVYCIGRNYRWSQDEATPVEMPAWFMKPANAVVPARGVLPYPPGTGDFCHEIELVVAIGRGGRDIAPARAQSHHIWGYAAGLDLTRRDLQQQAKQAGGPWEAAKAFDQSAPCTPLLPAAVFGHPSQGAVWLTVNGIERQRADVRDLSWPVPELVAMLSRSVTLAPGDLIYTGTPAGVGPLQPGDVVSGGVAGIGQFSMTVGSAS